MFVDGQRVEVGEVRVPRVDKVRFAGVCTSAELPNGGSGLMRLPPIRGQLATVHFFDAPLPIVKVRRHRSCRVERGPTAPCKLQPLLPPADIRFDAAGHGTACVRLPLSRTTYQAVRVLEMLCCGSWCQVPTQRCHAAALLLPFQMNVACANNLPVLRACPRPALPSHTFTAQCGCADSAVRLRFGMCVESQCSAGVQIRLLHSLGFNYLGTFSAKEAAIAQLGAEAHALLGGRGGLNTSLAAAFAPSATEGPALVDYSKSGAVPSAPWACPSTLLP